MHSSNCLNRPWFPRLGLKILHTHKKKEKDLLTLREVTRPCWWMRLNALKDTFR